MDNTQLSPAASDKDASAADTVSSSPRGAVIVLIHGTFAAHPNDSVNDPAPDARDADHKPRWWQRDSEFCSWLKSGFPSAEVQPAPAPGAGNNAGQTRTTTVGKLWVYTVGKLLISIVEKLWSSKSSNDAEQNTQDIETAFHWSGENSERSRREAGRRLYEHLDRVARRCEKQGKDLHVVAHSHGGSVLFEALQLDQSNAGETAAQCTPIHRTLKTWVTVATPFLKFSVDPWTSIAPLLILLSTAGVTFLRFEWFQQYWHQQSYGVLPWWHTAIALVAARVLPIFVVALFFRLLFNAFAFQFRGNADTDRRRQASQDLYSAVLAFGTVVSTTAVAWWLIGSECRQLTVDTAGIGHVHAASSVTLLALTCLTISGLKTFRPIGLLWAQSRRDKRRGKAWKFYQDRHRALPVGFETKDEAVRGLHAIIRKPVAEILPRIQGPDRKRFWGHWHYLISPEREFFKLSFSGWVAGSLLLPFSIFIDWVVKGFYNNIVCVALDSFVLTRLWKAAQGCDIPGLKMVDCQPLPFAGELQNNGHQDGVPGSMTAVEKTVDGNAGKLLQRARTFLGGDYKEGVDLFKLIKRTLAGDENDDILFHTTYLNTQEVAECISATCAGSGQNAYSRPTRITSPYPAADAKLPHPGQIGFYWWMLRYAILGCVLAIPAVSLYYACESIFFEWSRDHIQLSTRDVSGRFNVSEELVEPEDCYLLTIYMKAVSDRDELQRLLNSSRWSSQSRDDYLNAYDGNTGKLKSNEEMTDDKKRFWELFNAKRNPESIAVRSVTDRRKSVETISNFGDASLGDAKKICAVFRLIAAEQYQAAGKCLQSLQFRNWLTAAIVLNRDVSFLENEPLFGANP